MRSQYAREKARAAAMANEGLPINPWAYYESLLFLDDYVGPKGRRTTTDWNVEFSHVCAKWLFSYHLLKISFKLEYKCQLPSALPDVSVSLGVLFKCS